METEVKAPDDAAMRHRAQSTGPNSLTSSLWHLMKSNAMKVLLTVATIGFATLSAYLINNQEIQLLRAQLDAAQLQIGILHSQLASDQVVATKLTANLVTLNATVAKLNIAPLIQAGNILTSQLQISTSTFLLAQKNITLLQQQAASFTVVIGTTQVLSTTTTTIAFPTVSTGAANYDTSTSLYRAPFNGWYSIAFSGVVTGTATSATNVLYLDTVNPGGCLHEWIAASPSGGYADLSRQATVYMVAGQAAQFYVQGSGTFWGNVNCGNELPMATFALIKAV